VNKLVVHCKKDSYDVYVGRSPEGLGWGNPFSWKEGTLAEFKVETREESISEHRKWFLAQPDLIRKAKKELKGKVLACWCSPQTCHADVLAEVANQEGATCDAERIYAGIGSRETPAPICAMMKRIAQTLEAKNYTLRSGYADGADLAFDSGSKTKEVFLPWRGFNDSLLPAIPIHPLAFEQAESYHPNWERLSQGAKKLMARNSMQVFGADMNIPILFIICWTKDGRASGGTGQAIRIAKDHGIKVFNLFNEEDNKFWWSKIFEHEGINYY